jgi:hypothetical protein
MLFPYTYVPHSMEKMQEFIEYIFFVVWCKAPAGQPFGFDLFNDKPDLKAVMEAFYYSDAKGADFSMVMSKGSTACLQCFLRRK